MQAGDALPAVEKHVTQAQIDKYAQASGDFNPIHVDREFAAASQFGSTIAHGMMVAAAVSESLTAAFGRDWLENGRLKLRFRAPVLSDDRITASGQVKSVRAGLVTCSVAVRKQDGEDAITGEATVTVQGGPAEGSPAGGPIG